MTHGGADRPDDWVVLSEALPQLAQRLQAELTAIGLPALAEQIDGLVVQPCGCGEDYCASLRTSHPATRQDPARDQSALLDNLVVVDAPAGDITYIEILEAEVRQQLQRLFPSWPWDRKAKQPRRGKGR